MFANVENGFAAVLRWALRFPWTTVFLALSTLVGLIVLISRVPGEFIL